MTLRLRLVLATVTLLLVGLGAFGFTTYTLYARSQYDRLDSQIRSSSGFVTHQLLDASSGDSEGPQPPHGGPDDHDDRSPGPQVPLSTYSELRGADGVVVATVQLSGSATRPSLPSTVTAPPDRFLTVGSTAGTAQWRVFVTSAAEAPGDTVVIAVPLGEVTDSLHRLVLLELAGALVLLVALSAGSWVILRRGLRPLEEMAGTAREIAGGDIAKRVQPAGGASEVGQLGLALNTMLDEIEQAFAARDATEQRLRQFLSDASHELRTPLTSIQGFAELFRLGNYDRVDLPTMLRRIEEESGRMRALVDDLLLLARLDETRPLERRPVDLTVLAADACSDAAAVAPDRAVTLHAEGPVVVDGDQGLLRQAVANLVTNALRHTPAGTPLEVGASAEDGTAVLTVRDHGPGLDDDALAHVFDRFWRADRSRAGASTGLGLAIVAGVVAEHRGRVSAANAPGGGAVFTVRLPLAARAAGEPPATATASSPPDFRG